MRYQIIIFLLSLLILCNVNYVQCQESEKIEFVSNDKVVPSLPQGIPKRGTLGEFEFGIDKIVPHFIMGEGREEIPLTVYISIHWTGIFSPNVLVGALSDVDAADEEYVKDWSEYALHTVQDGQLSSEWKPRLGQESIVFYPSTSGHLPSLEWKIELNLPLSNENQRYRIFHIYLFIGNASSIGVANDFVMIMNSTEELLNNDTPYTSTKTTTITTTATRTTTHTKVEYKEIPEHISRPVDYTPYYLITLGIIVAGALIAIATYRKK